MYSSLLQLIRIKAQMKKILKPEQFAKWEEKQADRKEDKKERIEKIIIIQQNQIIV